MMFRKGGKSQRRQNPAAITQFGWVGESLFSFVGCVQFYFYCLRLLLFHRSLHSKRFFFTLFNIDECVSNVIRKNHAIQIYRENCFFFFILCLFCFLFLRENHLLVPWLRAYQYNICFSPQPRTFTVLFHTMQRNLLSMYYRIYCFFSLISQIFFSLLHFEPRSLFPLSNIHLK